MQIVLLALLNDGAILSIAYDNVRYRNQPEAWNMRVVLGMATILGIVGPVAAFGMFYLGDRVFHLGHPELSNNDVPHALGGRASDDLPARTRGPSGPSDRPVSSYWRCWERRSWRPSSQGSASS